MSRTYPLKPYEPTKFRDSSPSAVTSEVGHYKSMLGYQTASVDVGLFYQLNDVAREITGEAKLQWQTAGGLTPIEANTTYT